MLRGKEIAHQNRKDSLMTRYSETEWAAYKDLGSLVLRGPGRYVRISAFGERLSMLQPVSETLAAGYCSAEAMSHSNRTLCVSEVVLLSSFYF